ncbi:MAG TPA: SatD family protein [Nocardioidaceae bacterium]|nr:SatD family protein [Nocardioidaceae bacterium]
MTTQAAYTLIGDLVGSRQLADRAGAQRRLGEVLTEVTGQLGPLQPLEPTVGDEFQGAFAGLADATLATLLVRLALLPEVDVRCGIGYGEVTMHDATRRPLLQDGPGWWAARDALDAIGSRQRTRYAGPGAGCVNAFLVCRDALVERLNERAWRMLRMALLGETQQRIAEVEGVSKSAVSQQFSRGIAAVRDAQVLFASEE